MAPSHDVLWTILGTELLSLQRSSLSVEVIEAKDKATF